jgi:hypothetical protein
MGTDSTVFGMDSRLLGVIRRNSVLPSCSTFKPRVRECGYADEAATVTSSRLGNSPSDRESPMAKYLPYRSLAF